jgi:hypothetical protein
MKKYLILFLILLSVYPGVLGPLTSYLASPSKLLLVTWPWAYLLTAFAMCFVLGIYWKHFSSPTMIVLSTVTAVIGWIDYMAIWLPVCYAALTCTILIEEKLKRQVQSRL